MESYLGFKGITIDKVEREECIYDTNQSIDNEWLNK